MKKRILKGYVPMYPSGKIETGDITSTREKAWDALLKKENLFQPQVSKEDLKQSGYSIQKIKLKVKY
jgi:hypothetical protein